MFKRDKVHKNIKSDLDLELFAKMWEICTLASYCNFPSDQESAEMFEYNVHYQLSELCRHYGLNEREIEKHLSVAIVIWNRTHEEDDHVFLDIIMCY